MNRRLFTVWHLGMLWQGAIPIWTELEGLHTHISGVCEIFPPYTKEERGDMWENENRAWVAAGVKHRGTEQGRQGSVEASPLALNNPVLLFFYVLLKLTLLFFKQRGRRKCKKRFVFWKTSSFPTKLKCFEQTQLLLSLERAKLQPQVPDKNNKHHTVKERPQISRMSKNHRCQKSAE